jgi:hypothetical protein
MNQYQPSPIERRVYSKGALARRRERRYEIIGFVVVTLMFLPFEYAIVREAVRKLFGI